MFIISISKCIYMKNSSKPYPFILLRACCVIFIQVFTLYLTIDYVIILHPDLYLFFSLLVFLIKQANSSNASSFNCTNALQGPIRMQARKPDTSRRNRRIRRSPAVQQAASCPWNDEDQKRRWRDVAPDNGSVEPTRTTVFQLLRAYFYITYRRCLVNGYVRQ